MAKAVIKQVKMEIVGTWTVRYESGVIRSYNVDKLPKTAQAWLADHPEYANAAEMAMKWEADCRHDVEIFEALKGQGRGCGMAYAAELKKMRKTFVVWIAEGAGMRTIGNITKKAALEYLQG